MEEVERCEHCKKPRSICVCDRLPKLETHTRVLVLQHPQESDVDLGTVPLLRAALGDQCVVKVGLSWASLSHALGEEVENSRWAVIYPTKVEEGVPEDDVLLLDKKGRARDPSARIEGVVVLDGSWSQAKTLWWRNAWLLKLGRIVVAPHEPSIYGKLRKEPRREFVSTLEAVADVLVTLGEPEEVRAQLRRAMRTMVQRARDSGAKPPAPPQRRRIPLPRKK
ncbi:MAG: tRNA-uridine aminocarboxypropyltransferase [Polyangiales bacterium]